MLGLWVEKAFVSQVDFGRHRFFLKKMVLWMIGGFEYLQVFVGFVGCLGMFRMVLGSFQG